MNASGHWWQQKPGYEMWSPLMVRKVGLGEAGYWAHWLWALHSSSGWKGYDVKEPSGDAQVALWLEGKKQREHQTQRTKTANKRKDELLPSLPEVVGGTCTRWGILGF